MTNEEKLEKIRALATALPAEGVLAPTRRALFDILDVPTTGAVSVSEAGRRGGTRVRETHGPEHYARIGKIGGTKVAQRGRDFYVALGRKGGAEVAKRGPAFFEAIGKKGGEVLKAKYGHEHFAAVGRKGGAKVRAAFEALKDKGE